MASPPYPHPCMAPCSFAWPGLKEKLLPAPSLQGLCSTSMQAAEHARTCSVASSPSVLHATHLTLQAPTHLGPTGETAQPRPEDSGWGVAAASPAPGCANLRLTEQHCISFCQTRSCSRDRARGSAALVQVLCSLRACAAQPDLWIPPISRFTVRALGYRVEKWLTEWCAGVRAIIGDIFATSTEKGQCQLHEYLTCSPDTLFPSVTPTFLYKEIHPIQIRKAPACPNTHLPLSAALWTLCTP